MYKEKSLCQQVGNLLYAIANADGKITQHEKEAVVELVQYNWRHLFLPIDHDITDASELIIFQFDYNESESRSSAAAFDSFVHFVHQNPQLFDKQMAEKILASARRVAEGSRRINNKELHMIMELRQLLAHPEPGQTKH